MKPHLCEQDRESKGKPVSNKAGFKAGDGLEPRPLDRMGFTGIPAHAHPRGDGRRGTTACREMPWLRADTPGSASRAVPAEHPAPEGWGSRR